MVPHVLLLVVGHHRQERNGLTFVDRTEAVIGARLGDGACTRGFGAGRIRSDIALAWALAAQRAEREQHRRSQRSFDHAFSSSSRDVLTRRTAAVSSCNASRIR